MLGISRHKMSIDDILCLKSRRASALDVESSRHKEMIMQLFALKKWTTIVVRISNIMSSTHNKYHYQLDDLLSQITNENLHSKIDFGKPIGKELL